MFNDALGKIFDHTDFEGLVSLYTYRFQVKVFKIIGEQGIKEELGIVEIHDDNYTYFINQTFDALGRNRIERLI